MLVLTRKIGEQITVGDNITITVLEVQGQRIKLGIQAPDSYRILRAELPVEAPQRKTSARSEAAKSEPAETDPQLMEYVAARRRAASMSAKTAGATKTAPVTPSLPVDSRAALLRANYPK